MTWTSSAQYDRHPRFLDDQKDQASVLPCDESLCVSKTNFDSPFSCYAGNVTEFGNDGMCADGYIPQQIDDEPFYFTCCPPISSSHTYENIKRHCSDVITLSTNGTAKCVNASQPYLRPMKKSTYLSHEESFICCDFEIENTTDFLNITECVPYKNESYAEAIIPSNAYGAIHVLKCSHPGTELIHPNYMEDSSKGTRYECCRSSHDAATGPFITTDSAFKGTMYPQIVFSTIACICCTILIIALLIPLVKHLQPPTRATTRHTSPATATTARTITSAPSTTTSRRSDYSSYNLYLIYLCVPDLIFNMYLVVMYSSYALGYYNPNFSGYIILGDIYRHPDLESNIGCAFEFALIASCSTANLYLNTIVSYEIYVLLRNNHQVVRHKPPSFRRVSISAGSAYFLSIIVFCTKYFATKARVEAIIFRGDFTKRHNIYVADTTFSLLVCYIFPIGCFFLIWGTIIYRKYIPSITGRLKELVCVLR